MKRFSGFYHNKNRVLGVLKHLFSRFSFAHCCLLLCVLFSSSLSHAEEFVPFTRVNGEDYSKFHIQKPSMSSLTLVKVNHEKLIQNNIVFNVFNFKQLTEALDNATGGEVIVVRSNLRDKRYHYKQKQRFDSPVHIFGLLDGNAAPFFDNVTWENLHNVTLSHFKVSNLWNTGRNNYSWQIRSSNNVRLSNLHFTDKNNNLMALQRGQLSSILSSQSGLLIKRSNNILIDRTLFTDLFHGVEFHEMDSFYAVANKAVRVASDMFSGGGISNALFDSNLMHTRTPVFYKPKNRKQQYVHSDMIQLYTTNQKRGNFNITIRNNISLVGDTPLSNPYLTGWQCFFTRDEKGDGSGGRFSSLAYANVKIINNFCASNQHHGVTLSRGVDNVVAGNFVLLINHGKNKQQATGAIKIFDNKNCRILGNVSNKFVFDNLDNCQTGNNIDGFKANYPTMLSIMKQEIESAAQRTDIEVAASSNDLSKFYRSEGLKDNPLKLFDFSKLTLVPTF